MDRFSFLNAAHTQFFADLYEQYTQNPDSVEPSWRAFFQGFDFANEFSNQESLVSYAADAAQNGALAGKVEKEFQVLKLIEGYRTRGHLFTKTNPVRDRRTYSPTLAIENFGLSNADLTEKFDAAKTVGFSQAATLQEIISHLNNVYCQSIGVEYMYIRDPKVVQWIQDKLGKNDNLPAFNETQKKHILGKLNEAVSFENFLHTKYVGQKRFSLEGGESIIPGLDAVIEKAAEMGVEQFVMGMAHRGRLNVLANIFGKPTQDIFSEFDGKDYDKEYFDGDVKYHLGLTADRKTSSGKLININLAPNPSHLETVGAVIEGIARAKQDKYFPNDFSKVLPIAVHGDAAIAGQGIVYEIVQMSQLDGYKTGGTIHIVINNQVGFTTNYLDARSSTYCTDVAKVTLSPVLHVNADDVEAVVHAMLFALEYRMTFGKDVFIDLLGYRKYGHNEGDEPRFTQPILYKIISRHKNPRDIYAEKLIVEGIVNQDYINQIEAAYKAKLEENLEASRQKQLTVITPFMQNEWQGFEQVSVDKMLQKVDTSFPQSQLNEIIDLVSTLPADKKFINKIQKIVSDRKTMYENDTIDWGTAETLAYASLLSEGYDVRISGQDVERGTFSHRHAVVKVEDSEEEVVLLQNIPNTKGNFRIYNSFLSEYGVLGFDYGYALANPNALTIWEAQFGDFSNGAQIMIDQYISSGEDKWNNQNGIVMLLPHGYEGQGAEHSSARLERYLQLCARHNMYIANVTTPANIFHLLRRQMKTNFRKPLVVMSPKSLLRHPEAISAKTELANGHFQEVIDDPNVSDKKAIKTLVFVSGKFYYDIKAEREKLGRNDVALVRLEQLFPLATDQIQEIIKSYPNADDFVWAQEEPKNMGAYGYMLMNFDLVPWRLASLKAYAAPASGSFTRDRRRHHDAIRMVFDKNLFR
jgi:2-oxoglutarate dehydrogenase E1 component